MALGPKFDIKGFSRVMLEGVIPLTILERVVEADTSARLRNDAAANGARARRAP